MFCSEDYYDTIEDVSADYPSAAMVVPVEGGWRVFEDMSEYHTWINQL